MTQNSSMKARLALLSIGVLLSTIILDMAFGGTIYLWALCIALVAAAGIANWAVTKNDHTTKS